MRILLLLFVVLFLPLSFATADTCLKMKSHTDGYYYGGRMNPPVDEMSEVWCGDSTMAYITDNRAIVVDLKNQSLLWINRNDSTYAQTTLPFDWGNLVTEETVAWLGQYPRKGIVTETDEVKEIDGRKCKCWEITSWIAVEDGRYRETDEKLWTTKDLPIEWEAFKELNSVFITLRNTDEDYGEALRNIEGWPLLSDGDLFIKGFSVKTTESIVEILEKDPPPNVYSVPAGFTEKEKLTIQDIRG